MPNPYTATDVARLLYRSRTLDLDASIFADEHCRCRRDWKSCAQPYRFMRPDGSLGAVLDCRNGDAVIDALVDEGQPLDGLDLDHELIRRLDAAVEAERQARERRAA